jgi:hypothetical protein
MENDHPSLRVCDSLHVNSKTDADKQLFGNGIRIYERVASHHMSGRLVRDSQQQLSSAIVRDRNAIFADSVRVELVLPL